MVDLQCMVSYVKWSRATKSGDFLPVENGVTKEYPFLLEIKVQSLLFVYSFIFKMIFSSECHNVRVGWIPMLRRECPRRNVFINSPANKQIWKDEASPQDSAQSDPSLCDGCKVSQLQSKVLGPNLDLILGDLGFGWAL